MAEGGQFLALDLGGTNFRVLHLVLGKGRIVKEQSKHYHIEDELRVGCGLKLFDFIAECISSFVHEHQLADLTLPLGMFLKICKATCLTNYHIATCRGHQ